MILNTLYYDTTFNTYENYLNNKIVLNIKGYKSVKNYYYYDIVYGVVYEQNTVNKITKTECRNKKWKQVMYFGFSMTYEQMNDMIDKAYQNKVTHIIIPFIELNINNDGTNDSLYIRNDLPLYNWIENFTREQRNSINDKLNSYNMILLCSFGGSFTFNKTVKGEYVGTQYVLNSPNYQDPYVLAENIVDLLYRNNIYNIDYDIEHIPDYDDYNSNFEYLVYYFGLLHKHTRKIFMDKYKIKPLITGARQTPYFSKRSNYNSYSWNNIYSKIDKYYGMYIDFYNVQFYNQLYYPYTEYSTIFEHDYLFNASVVELSKIIPLHKIVVGKIIAEQVDYIPLGFMGYVVLYDENIKNTMANFVEKTKKSHSKILNKWFKHSGIMVWLYKFTDSIDSNQSLLNYYNYSGNLHN